MVKSLNVTISLSILFSLLSLSPHLISIYYVFTSLSFYSIFIRNGQFSILDSTTQFMALELSRARHQTKYFSTYQKSLKSTEVWRHQIFFFAFQHFHDNISVEHDEKPSHTKFDMNWFMVARDMAVWIPN